MYLLSKRQCRNLRSRGRLCNYRLMMNWQNNLLNPRLRSQMAVIKNQYLLNQTFLKMLANNHKSALKRMQSLHRNTARHPKLKSILLDTFAELLHEEQLISVDDHAWYLPFFVASTAKPRMVCNGAA